MSTKKEVKFIHCLMPILVLVVSIMYGLGLRPYVFDQEAFPVEMMLLFGLLFTAIELKILGFTWQEMQDAIVKKLFQGLPAWLIILCIGVLTGAWIISGTVPMLIYYGIKIINPQYIYVIALLITALFSLFTGTSWGSISTIGVVMISIGIAVDAHIPIVAAAVIGGAFFGDKMSPLSDTTNLAAIVADVPLYDHIRSMMNSTVPALIISIIFYVICGFIYPPNVMNADTVEIQEMLHSLQTVFNFNILLLIPVLIVLYGSFKKKPTVPVMIISSFVAVILGFFSQNFSASSILQTLTTGFKISMATWITDGEISTSVFNILERGGIYYLMTSVITAWILFASMACFDLIDAMPRVVNKVFAFAKTRFSIVATTLVSGVFTMGITGHVYAAIMIPGDVFRSKFDKYGISRKVLSRCLEDAGTFFDPVFPWTVCGVFCAATTGVPTLEYLPWLTLNLSNFIISLILAYTGWGCYINTKKKQKAEENAVL